MTAIVRTCDQDAEFYFVQVTSTCICHLTNWSICERKNHLSNDKFHGPA